MRSIYILSLQEKIFPFYGMLFLQLEQRFAYEVFAVQIQIRLEESTCTRRLYQHTDNALADKLKDGRRGLGQNLKDKSLNTDRYLWP